jgi:hypothetical protein
MALSAMLHVAGLGGAAAIQSGAVSPFRVKLYPIRRVSHHESGLALAQQLRHSVWAGGIPAEDAMPAADTQVAESGHRVVRQRRRGVGFVLVIWDEQQIIDFLRVEAC